jgi:hypothetical protein
MCCMECCALAGVLCPGQVPALLCDCEVPAQQCCWFGAKVQQTLAIDLVCLARGYKACAGQSRVLMRA